MDLGLSTFCGFCAWDGPTRFGALKRQMEGISSKVLTERLRMLEEAEIVYRSYKPSIPPEVTYGLTQRSQDLIVVLDQLAAIAHKWYPQENHQLQEKYSQVALSLQKIYLSPAISLICWFVRPIVTIIGYNKWYYRLVVNTAMEREAITIRFPTDLLAKARSLKENNESLNDLMVDALQREVQRRRGWNAHQRIVARSEAVQAKTGIQQASTNEISILRQGERRRE